MMLLYDLSTLEYESMMIRVDATPGWCYSMLIGWWYGYLSTLEYKMIMLLCYPWMLEYKDDGAILLYVALF